MSAAKLMENVAKMEEMKRYNDKGWGAESI